MNEYIQVLNTATGKLKSISLFTLINKIKEILTPKVPIQPVSPVSNIPHTFLSNEQWNIVMMDVRRVWKLGVNGRGITIMIVDNGVDNTHPDLHNVNTQISATALLPPSECPGNGICGIYIPAKKPTHGTMCASVAAGTGSKYVTGVAWGATLGSVNIFPDPSSKVPGEVPLSIALTYSLPVVDIYSCSFGPAFENCPQIEPEDTPAIIAIKKGTTQGRNGKGAIYVFIAGNDNSISVQTPDARVSNIHEVIVVGSVDKMGTIADYSVKGPAILVSAPGGLDTTPNTGPGVLAALPIDMNYILYTLGFNGTSAACPHISGLCALMLQVRPALTWRDVQQILMYSARQISITKDELVTNANNKYYSNAFGYGVPDALVACKLSKIWPLLPPMVITKEIQSFTPIPIPMTLPPFSMGVSRSFIFPSLTNQYVEVIIVSVQINGSNISEINIVVTSPSGTTIGLSSAFMPPPGCTITDQFTINIPIKAEGFRDELAFIPGKPWIVTVTEIIIGAPATLSAVSLEIDSYPRTPKYNQEYQAAISTIDFSL